MKERWESYRREYESNVRIARSLHKLLSDLDDGQTIVVVEGRRDRQALKSLGYNGRVFEMCGKGKGTKNLVSELAVYKKVIVMFDFDKRGERLTRTIVEKLTYGGLTIDLTTRRKIKEIAYDVEHIEDLKRFSKYLIEELSV
ncbi:MAG: toprim domain-containing protein [Nitrososphaeria archaeon]